MAGAVETPERDPRAPEAPARGSEPGPSPVLPGTEWLVQRLRGPLASMWAHGFRFLFVLDAVALYLTMLAINLVRFGLDWPTYPRSHYLVGFGVATSIHLLVNYFAGLYEREPRLGASPWLGRVSLATVIAVSVDGLAAILLGRYLMPRLSLAMLLVVGSIVLTLNRRLSRRLAHRRQGPPRVVLIGDDDDVQLARAHLADSDRDARFVGSLPSNNGLRETLDRSRATDVLLLDVGAFGAIFPEPLTSLERIGVGFLQRVSARETLLGLRQVRQVAGMPFVPLRVHTVATHQRVLKRTVDLVLVTMTAPLWLVAFAALAGYVRVRAGAPVLYRQQRVGRDGVPFALVKFRTMRADAEAAGPQLATRADPRVIPKLAWLRSTRADELPQLLNVLRGEMSLVGPRPERPELVESIAARVPGYVRRLELPPGLTGMAQIYGDYATDPAYKLGYDLHYLVNWSPILDLQILTRTVWVVLARRG